MAKRLADPTTLFQAAVIALAVVWIYGPALRGDWVWDDTLLVTQNSVVHDPAGLWKIWFAPGCMFDYQPVKFSVVWLQWHLWGNDPLGYHLTNVLLHLVSALLIWRWLRKFGLKFAWLGGLIFAVHPLQVESVAFISELKNTLSLPPFLWAMGAFMDYDERGRRRDYLLALGLFLVALLCKTTMVMFPCVILLYAWWQRDRVTWRDLKTSLPFFVMSLALGVTTLWFQQHHGDAGKPAEIGWLSRLILAGWIIGFYLAKFLWPVAVSPTYPVWKLDAGSFLDYVPWLALVAAIFGCWKKRMTWGRAALLGLGFFLINLVPALVFLVGKYPEVVWSLDHLVYIPMLGLIGLVVAGLEKVDKRLPGYSRLVWIVPMVAVMILMAWESHDYAAVFAQPKTLWTYALQHDPTSIEGHMNLGQILSQAGRSREAANQFRLALQTAPFYAKAHFNLANEWWRLGETEEAAKEYEMALKIDPALRQACLNLGGLLEQEGRTAEAVEQLQRAVQLDPGDAKSRLHLGNLLRKAGRLDEAKEQYEQAAQLEPDNAKPPYGLALLDMRQGRVPEALKQCEEALRLKPDFADAYFIRGNLELFRKDLDAAYADFSKAIQLDPKMAEAYFRLGPILQMRGDLKQALADLEAGCACGPKDPLADYARLSIWVIEAQGASKAEADRELAAALADHWNAGTGDWETQMARFLLDQMTEGNLLATAGANSGSKQVLVCEAWYFAGMKRLSLGQKAEAIRDLRKCIATNQRNSIKYDLAEAELQALGLPGP